MAIRLSPNVGNSLAVASLTMSILSVALALGLIPDREGALLQGRKTLSEALAIHCSAAAQRGDYAEIEAALGEAIHRNPDLLSAAVRGHDGNLLAKAGKPPIALENDASAVAPVQISIRVQNQQDATVELRFAPLTAGGFLAFLRSPVLPLFAFTAVASFLVHLVHARLIRGRQNADQASAVPNRIRAVLDTLAEGLIILDERQRIVLANEAFAKMLNRSPGDLQGRSVSELPWTQADSLEPPEDYPWTRAIQQVATQAKKLLSLRGDNSRPLTVAVNSAPILGEDGSCRGTLATFDDLTPLERKNAHLRKLLLRLRQSRAEIHQQNQKLKDIATRDPLTDCLNRRFFFAEFENQWSAARRYGHSLSCVMLDIDHFKSVNDRYGHGVGDKVLQQVAEELKSMVRQSDLVCRYGGEEFCILLPHIDAVEAARAGERFRRGIEARNYASVAVTASFGVSTLSPETAEPRELLDQADRALYAAKRGGRNRVVCWDEIRDQSHTPATQTQPPAAVVARQADVPIPFHAVTALLSALAYRDAATAEHSRRVADLCVATADGLLSLAQCYVLEVAGLLHDIGKLGVPDAVLLKPGPLNEDEWKVIRTHERIGEEIITAAFTSEELTAITRNHHAWYSGAPHDPSLPTGLDIPVGARILSIADAFDAMVSDRVYRKGRSHEEAFAELRRCAGKQFDPELVERFITAVVARDENRRDSSLAVSKQTALRIGMQIENLARAVDARDVHTVKQTAGQLQLTAQENGITAMAEASVRLQQVAVTGSDWIVPLQEAMTLMKLCRSTYRAYVPSAKPKETRTPAEETKLFAVGGQKPHLSGSRLGHPSRERRGDSD